MPDRSESPARAVCRILSARRREIHEVFKARMPEAGPHYSTRPPEELAETTGQAVAAFLAVFCADDWGPMDAFVQEISARRFALKFPLSEVQRAFTLFRDICHPFLTEAFSGKELDRALQCLDRVVDEAIQRFSDTYQQLHMEEIRATSAELAEAHRKLQEQYRDVAEASRIKSQFFANMSHELRSPLNSIIGYAELLLDGIDGPLTGEQSNDLRKILASSRYLLKLINNILDMTKIEAGRMGVDVAPFDVPGLVAEAVDTVAPLAYRKRLELRTRIPETVRVFRSDREKVKQVLINLLANAVKFTDEGEVVCAVEPEAGGLRFEVRDTGIGIPPEEQERIFTKFFQIDASHAREHRGTGLGLPLCRMLVELLGGRIGLESEPGKGSRFWFWVPEALGHDAREPGAGPRGLPARVLVVEDDPSAQELLRKVLETEGMEAVIAVDGAEGLRLARELRPDAITLDLLMPRVDGWEFLERLKADPATRDIPVVVVSCVDRREEALKKGADAHLVKPLDREDLVATLRRVLGRGEG